MVHAAGIERHERQGTAYDDCTLQQVGFVKSGQARRRRLCPSVAKGAGFGTGVARRDRRLERLTCAICVQLPSRLQTSLAGIRSLRVGVHVQLPDPASAPRTIAFRGVARPARLVMASSSPQTAQTVPDVSHEPHGLLADNVAPPADQYRQRHDESDGQDRKGVEPGVQAGERSKVEHPLEVRRQEQHVLQAFKLFGAGLVGNIVRMGVVDIERARPLRREFELQVSRERHGRKGYHCGDWRRRTRAPGRTGCRGRLLAGEAWRCGLYRGRRHVGGEEAIRAIAVQAQRRRPRRGIEREAPGRRRIRCPICRLDPRRRRSGHCPWRM